MNGFAAGPIAPFLAGGVCLALVIGMSVFLWAKWRLKRRGTVACRIPALLRLGTRGGDPIIDGYVTLLDRGTARFAPDMPDEVQDAIERLTDLPVALIAVSLEVPALLSRVDAESVGLFFEVPLEAEACRHLLSHSTISPYPAKPSRKGPKVRDHIRRKPEPARAISFSELNRYRNAASQSSTSRRRMSDLLE